MSGVSTAGGGGAVPRALVDISVSLTGLTLPILFPATQSRYNSFGMWLRSNLDFTVADTGADTITATSHGRTTGDGPFYVKNTGGGLPAPLTNATKYWAIVVDANTLKLATSKALALAGTAVDLTTSGTGTQTLAWGETLIVPAGVTCVEIMASMSFEALGTAGNVTAVPVINSGASPGALNLMTYGSSEVYYRQGTTGNTTNIATVHTPPIPVTEGDLFALYCTATMTAQDAIVASRATWFAMKAIEWS